MIKRFKFFKRPQKKRREKREQEVKKEQEEAQEHKTWEFCIGKRYSWLGVE